MWKKNEIKNLSASSVVDLKAELFKTKQGFEISKRKATPAVVSTRIFPSKKKPKNTVTNDQEMRSLEESWVSLNRKTAFYENQLEDPNLDNDNSLVDFVEKNLSQDSDWIEVSDQFGRTRLVKKEDSIKPIMEKPKPLPPPTHFDSKREIRNLGVGFYQFSHDEDDRQRQLNQLNDLRNNTISSRVESVKIKQEKKLKMNDRVSRILEKRRQNQVSEDVDEFLKSVREAKH